MLSKVFTEQQGVGVGLPRKVGCQQWSPLLSSHPCTWTVQPLRSWSACEPVSLWQGCPGWGVATYLYLLLSSQAFLQRIRQNVADSVEKGLTEENVKVRALASCSCRPAAAGPTPSG